MTGWQWTAISGSGETTTSHTIDGHTYGKEYRYKIRAVNLGGNSKPAPGAAPWYLSVTIPDPAPPPVDNLWVVRVCDELFKVRWNFVPGATGYDLNMSLSKGKSWERKMTNKNVNAWKLSYWTKNKTFRFAVRAVNAHGASEWRTVESHAPPCAVEGLGASYAANGTMYTWWKPAKRASGYDVNFSADNGRSWQRMESNTAETSASFTKDPAALPYNPNFLVAVQSRKGNLTGGWRNAPITGLTASSVAGTIATLNLWNYSGNWYYKANEPPDDALCNGPVSGADKDLTGLHAGTDYQYTAYIDSSCTHTISSVTFATPVTLTVSNVTVDGATLNLDGHDLQWWYDADTGPDNPCQGPVAAGTSTANLTGLTVNQQYTYRAYNAAGCNSGTNDQIASVTFTPTGVSVSNLGETNDGISYVGRHGTNKHSSASAFTTGSNSGGYNLQGVTVSMGSIVGSPTGFTAAIHASSGGDPATTATYTLSGESQPDDGDYTYTCSGTCSLDAGISYFLVMSATGPGSGNHHYQVQSTSSDNETNTPAGSGWSISNVLKYKQSDGGAWETSLNSYVDKFKVTATPK